jgi:formylmethanofuran dehydrogenase subunit E
LSRETREWEEDKVDVVDRMDMDGVLPEDLRSAVAFHGHLCPGLLIGYRAVRAAMETRARLCRGQILCIPCLEKQEGS